ncbi:MAG: hypothetical protein ACLUZ4_01350 [Christensenellaceae bacterium]
MQRASCSSSFPKNRPLVRKALRLADRDDLIGSGRELSRAGCASKPGTQRRLFLCDKKQSPFAVWSDGTFGNQTKRCAAVYPFRFR